MRVNRYQVSQKGLPNFKNQELQNGERMKSHDNFRRFKNQILSFYFQILSKVGHLVYTCISKFSEEFPENFPFPGKVIPPSLTKNKNKKAKEKKRNLKQRNFYATRLRIS